MLISPVLSDMLSAADLGWIIYGLYVQGVPLKSPPLNFSKCRIVENMAES